MTSLSYRKLIIVVGCVVALAAALPVHAQIPVTDAGAISAIGAANGLLTSIQTSSAGTTSLLSANKTQQSVEDAIEVVAYNLAQQLSRKLVAMAINEINGGASGVDHPQQFVTSYNQLYQNINDQQVSMYANALMNNNTNPFSAAVGLNIVNSYSNNTTGLNQFALNNYSNGNWQASASNLSNSGIYGWDYYMQSALPQNNPSGSQFIAQQELASNISSAQDIQTTQLSSSGYKASQTPCDINYNSNANASVIANAQAQLAAAQTGLQAAMDAGGGAPTPGQQNAINSNENDVALAQQALQNAQNAQDNANTQFGVGCAKQVITNPVGAVDTLAAQAINQPFQDLEKQSKWYTLIANTLITFAQGLINTGISHLQLELHGAIPLNGGNTLNHF